MIKPVSLFSPLVAYSSLRFKLSEILFFFSLVMKLPFQARLVWPGKGSAYSKPQMLSAHNHAMNSHCCWRHLALSSARALPARARSGWGPTRAPCLAHRVPAKRPPALECRAQRGPSKTGEAGVKKLFKSTSRDFFSVWESHKLCSTRKKGCTKQGTL